MIKIKEARSKKEQRAFIKFPLELYKGNEYFVPMLYSGEFSIFDPEAPFNKVCDNICFLAYEGERVVGRIQGIIQREANEKWGQKRVRFTRFDAIDDEAVSSALFKAVEDWAKKKGMEEFVGPLGYSDLEREGLLIEGFDQVQTFEEQYNFPYYQKLIEAYGFDKDVDWIEYQLYAPEKSGDRLIELSKKMLERYGLRVYVAKSIKELIDKHIDGLFEIIEKAYSRLYGTMPLNDEIVKNYVKDFKLIVRPQDVPMIFDKNDRMIGFALMFPSISEAVRRSNGHVTPAFLARFLRDKKNPKILDLGLIGILPEYESRGIPTILIGELINQLREGRLHHLETNLMLENNHNIQNLMKHFDKKQNKRRRCFKKTI
ncbi:MAG: hypothetical protein II117_04180 [Clostridia bacterium]|nr:hypothetical protein [Clostridia bacterium]